MYLKGKLGFIFLCIPALISTSCRKDEGTLDFRDPYMGDYNFEVVQRTWMLGEPDTYDTFNMNGFIKKYDYADSELNNLSPIYADSTTMATYDQKITIRFLSKYHIISDLNKNGSLVNLSGYHYGHSGAFIGTDSISFAVGGFGGLGGGHGYTVNGKK